MILAIRPSDTPLARWFTGELRRAGHTVYQQDRPSVDGLIVLDERTVIEPLEEIAFYRKNHPRSLTIIALGSWTEARLVAAFTAGADAVEDRGLLIPELLARLESIHARRQTLTARRPARDQSPVIFADYELRIDLDRRQIERQGAPVSLSATEWRLLHALAERPGGIDSHALYQRVWGFAPTHERDRNNLRSYLFYLRRKLGADRVLNLHAHGSRGCYRLNVERLP